jgi:Uma2 family endonuclease
MRTAERRSKPRRRAPSRNGGVQFRLAGRVIFPAWITDHESFREWARSPECPEKLRVAFYDGGIWVDPDMEQLFVHNQVKYRIGLALGPVVEGNGLYIPDGMLLSHPGAGFSTLPDGYFVSYEALRTGRVRQVPRVQGGCTELEGTPEMILEVVSDSSVQKDLFDMPPKYFAAGVQEFWTVDVRTSEPVFQLWKRGPKGFILPRKLAGHWRKSEVFGRSFRLVSELNPLGGPTYTLEVK